MKEQYKNYLENEFAKKAKQLKWEVTKRGYPDFICYKPNGDVVLVEVKPTNHRLKKSQYKLMNALKKYGIKCYRWSPDKDWLN